MTLFLIILGIILLCGAIFFCFVPRGWSAITAFAGLLCLHFSGVAPVENSQLWFWGLAALIVLGLSVLLPAPVVTSRKGVGYIVIGAIAGLTVGLVISANVMILGGVAGALCGALAYSRTPSGRFLEFPSRKFINYLCAKALPPVIALSIVAVAVVMMLHAPHLRLLV